jgi:hypothetical protein
MGKLFFHTFAKINSFAPKNSLGETSRPTDVGYFICSIHSDLFESFEGKDGNY